MAQTRINWIDTARAVSIVLVVVLHVRNEFLLFTIHSPALDRFVEVSTTFRMPLFFAVAGLLAGKWLHARWRDLLRHKISLLVWVLIVWQPIVLLYKLINHWVLGTFSNAVLTEEVLRASISLIRPNGELWFLWTLTMFFLFGRVSSRFSPAKQVGAATSVAILWMSLVEPMLPETLFRALGSGWIGLFRYYFLFVGFALFSRIITARVSKTKWYTSVAVFTVSVSAAVIAEHFSLPTSATSFLLTVLAVMGGLALAKIIGDSGLLQYLGRHTLEVYLAHSTIIAVATCALLLLGLDPFLRHNVILAASTLVCLTIACSLALSKWRVTKYMYQQPKWFSLELVHRPTVSDKTKAQ